jgi:DNA polymerase-1
MRTWLVFDCNYLLWRAHFTTGHLSHGGDATGAVFGFLKSVRDLKNQFMTDKVIFTFDHGKLLREEIAARYKAARKEKERQDPEDVKRAKAQLRRQIEDLKLKHLKRAGYRNVWFQDGYEADDMIALACEAVANRGGRAVIITGDKDMYQLLSAGRVQVYHPREQVTMTEKGFVKKYGIAVEAWKFVKAIGGCYGDTVPGVPGCREKTALAYMRGELKKTDARRKAIRCKEGLAVVKRNLKLVKLPFPGAAAPPLKEDRYDEGAFAGLCGELGFESLTPRRPRVGFKLGGRDE